MGETIVLAIILGILTITKKVEYENLGNLDPDSVYLLSIVSLIIMLVVAI
jgi:hypothetical protein